MIDKMGNTIVNDKVKSVYGFNDYSIQDLLSKFFEQINSVTDLVNQNEEKINTQNFKLEEFINYMKSEGIPPIVIETVTTMYNDGRLTELFNSLANNVIDKVEDFKTQVNSQLEQIMINVETFKTENNTYDDAIKKAILKAKELKGVVYFPSGIYEITQPIEIYRNTRLKGNSNINGGTKLIKTSINEDSRGLNSILFTQEDNSIYYCEFIDLEIVGNNGDYNSNSKTYSSPCYGLDIPNLRYSKFDNFTITNCYNAIVGKCYDHIEIDRIQINYAYKGIELDSLSVGSDGTGVTNLIGTNIGCNRVVFPFKCTNLYYSDIHLHCYNIGLNGNYNNPNIIDNPIVKDSDIPIACQIGQSHSNDIKISCEFWEGMILRCNTSSSLTSKVYYGDNYSFVKKPSATNIAENEQAPISLKSTTLTLLDSRIQYQNGISGGTNPIIYLDTTSKLNHIGGYAVASDSSMVTYYFGSGKEQLKQLNTRFVGNYIKDGVKRDIENIHHIRVKTSKELTIDSINANQTILFDTTVFSKGYLALDDNGKIIVNESGTYQINLNVAINGSGNHEIGVIWQSNTICASTGNSKTTGWDILSCSTIQRVANGDFILAYVKSDTTGNTLPSRNQVPVLTIHKID